MYNTPARRSRSPCHGSGIMDGTLKDSSLRPSPEGGVSRSEGHETESLRVTRQGKLQRHVSDLDVSCARCVI